MPEFVISSAEAVEEKNTRMRSREASQVEASSVCV